MKEKKLFNLENQLVDELLIDGKEKLPNSIKNSKFGSFCIWQVSIIYYRIMP